MIAHGDEFFYESLAEERAHVAAENAHATRVMRALREIASFLGEGAVADACTDSMQDVMTTADGDSLEDAYAYLPSMSLGTALDCLARAVAERHAANLRGMSPFGRALFEAIGGAKL